MTLSVQLLTSTGLVSVTERVTEFTATDAAGNTFTFRQPFVPLVGYASITAGQAATDTGGGYKRDTTGNLAATFINQAGGGEHTGWEAATTEGAADLARITARENRTYTWDDDIDCTVDFDGAGFKNCGTEASSFVSLQMFGGAAVGMDEDGGTTNERFVNTSGVTNSQGDEDLTQYSFNSTNDKIQLASRAQVAGLGSITGTIFIEQRISSDGRGAGMISGSSSNGAGATFTWNPTASYTVVSGDFDFSDTGLFELVSMRVDSGAADLGDLSASPVKLDIGYAIGYPRDHKEPTQAEVYAEFDNRHAKPQIAAQGVITMAGGGWTPDALCPSVTYPVGEIELTTGFEIACMFKLVTPDYATGYVAPFGAINTVNPRDTPYDAAMIRIESDLNGPRDGYLTPYPNKNNLPDTEAICIPLFGRPPTSVIVGFEFDASDDAYEDNDLLSASRPGHAYTIFDGYPLNSDPCAHPSETIRMMGIGGVAALTTRSAQDSYNVEGGTIYSAQDRFNKAPRSFKDHARERMEEEALLAANGIVGFPKTRTAVISKDNDSTAKLPGSEHDHIGRFLDLSTSIYDTIAMSSRLYDDDDSNGISRNAYNAPEVIEWRNLKIEIAKDILGFPDKSYLRVVGGPQNNTAHLADPSAAFLDYKALFIDNEAANYGDFITSLLESPFPQGSSDPLSTTNVEIKGYRDELLTRFPTIVDPAFPLLRAPAPGDTSQGFHLMLDCWAWAPIYRAGPTASITASYTDWYAMRAAEEGGTRDIGDGSLVHFNAPWGGYEWARFLAEAYSRALAYRGITVAFTG